VTCLRVTLDAIDTARAQEGMGPMDLPANFAQLSVPEQLFVRQQSCCAAILVGDEFGRESAQALAGVFNRDSDGGLRIGTQAEAHVILRRDIFDPTTVSGFAATVNTHERLQRLCLMTYADIHAVNPEALTPWKAEMLWQLFVATSNHFSRTLDRDRLHASDEAALLEQVRAQAGGVDRKEIERFLDGFPRRYLAVHSAAEIAAHFALYRNLGAEPVQTGIKKTQHAYALTLLSADRPALFATIAGALAAWGMNIVKADAFANTAGVVLDTFHFVDLHRTLELNPGEILRFQQSIADVLNGKQALEPLLKGRLAASVARPPKVVVPTAINFDEGSSDHCTLVEVVTQDRPGLLYGIGSALARLACNIEVALIDTEGQKAIDVFYLTSQGNKLTAQKQELLREVLQATLA